MDTFVFFSGGADQFRGLQEHRRYAGRWLIVVLLSIKSHKINAKENKE